MNKKLSKLSHIVLAILLVILPTLLLVTQGNTAIIRAQTAPNSPPVSPPDLTPTPTQNLVSIRGKITINGTVSNIVYQRVSIARQLGNGYETDQQSIIFIDQSLSTGVKNYSFEGLTNAGTYKITAEICKSGSSFAYCQAATTPIITYCSGTAFMNSYCLAELGGGADFTFNVYPTTTPTSTPGITIYPSPTITPTTVPTATPTPTSIPLPTPESNPTMTVQSINYSLFAPAPGIINVSTYVEIINTKTYKGVPNAKVNLSIIVPNNSSYILSGITDQYGRVTLYQNLPRYAGTYYIDVTNVIADNYIYVPTKTRTSFTIQQEVTPSPTAVPSPTATPTKAPTATPTPTSIPSPTPVTGTSVTIRASGSVCLSAYPTMVLKLGGVEVKRWNQVTSVAQDYIFTSPSKYAGAASVHFINDCYRPPEDRNLFVDYITINGKTIQSEATGVYNTGGYGEWLWSNGYIQYPSSTVTIPSPTPTSIQPSPTPYTPSNDGQFICERNYSSPTTCEAPLNCIRNGGTTTDTYCGVSSFCCLH